MRCPRCSGDLSQISYLEKVFIFSCPACHGQAVTMSGLRAIGIDEESIKKIWSAAVNGQTSKELPCPECNDLMQSLKIDDGQTVFFIDVCTMCHVLWFDLGELEKLPLEPEKETEDIPQKAKEILAEYAIKNVKPPSDCDPQNWMYASYRNFRLPTEQEMPFFIISAILNLILRLLH
jgi:Zn-finger nucleic acid-binding protein